jgi:hypothetical protein
LAVKPDESDRSNPSPPLVSFTPSRRLDLNFAALKFPLPSAVTLRLKLKSTSLKLLRPSARSNEKALLFHRAFRPGVSKTLPCSGEVPLSGFGYPLSGFKSSFRPRIPLSGSSTLGLRPAKLCSFFTIRKKVSSSPLRSCALCENRFRPSPGAPAASSREESRVFAPRRVSSR